MCEDLWDEHEGAFTRLTLRREASYAAGLCVDQVEICDEPMELKSLLRFAAAYKDEL